MTETASPIGSLPKPLWLFSAVMVLNTVISCIYGWLYPRAIIIAPRASKSRFMAHFPGIPGSEAFLDLVDFVVRFHSFHTRGFFSGSSPGISFSYPAAMSLVLRLFLPRSMSPVLLFLVFTGILAGGAAIGLALALIRRGVSRPLAAGFAALNLLLSGVLWFEIHQANTEIFVLACMSLFVFLYLKGHFRWAAAVLGVAIALKLYPFILLGLLFAAKRYRDIAISILSAIVATLAGLWGETGSILLSLRGTVRGLRLFSNNYALKVDAGIGWDHSLLALAKQVALHHPGWLAAVTHLYMPLAAALALLCYFARIYRLPVYNQIAALSMFSILLPPVSFEYTMIELYPAFLLFCCLVARNHGMLQARKTVVWMSVCFAFLFALQNNFFWHGMLYEGQVKCVVLILLLALTIAVPLPDDELDWTARPVAGPLHARP